MGNDIKEFEQQFNALPPEGKEAVIDALKKTLGKFSTAPQFEPGGYIPCEEKTWNPQEWMLGRSSVKGKSQMESTYRFPRLFLQNLLNIIEDISLVGRKHEPVVLFTTANSNSKLLDIVKQVLSPDQYKLGPVAPLEQNFFAETHHVSESPTDTVMLARLYDCQIELIQLNTIANNPYYPLGVFVGKKGLYPYRFFPF